MPDISETGFAASSPYIYALHICQPLNHTNKYYFVMTFVFGVCCFIFIDSFLTVTLSPSQKTMYREGATHHTDPLHPFHRNT